VTKISEVLIINI